MKIVFKKFGDNRGMSIHLGIKMITNQNNILSLLKHFSYDE
jgi:hypothetical protein